MGTDTGQLFIGSEVTIAYAHERTTHARDAIRSVRDEVRSIQTAR
jgi:hypothetical protein